MSNTASIIREARQLITPPDAWTQGALARHKNGNLIGVQEENAACFCAVGAIVRAAVTDDNFAAAFSVVRAVCPTHIPVFNDTHTHGEVLALLDKAALAAEAAA